MAQINITLNQEEILQILTDAQGEGFRKLLEASLNKILKAESTKQLGAEPYERTETRTDSRNGTRERELTTRIGTITLQVPNVESVLRLMGAVLMEENDKIQTTDYSIFYQPAYEELCNSESKLKEIAREQRALLAA